MKFENIVNTLANILSGASGEFFRIRHAVEANTFKEEKFDTRYCNIQVKQYNDTVASFHLNVLQVAEKPGVSAMESLRVMLTENDPQALSFDTWMSAADHILMARDTCYALADICRAIAADPEVKSVHYVATTQKECVGVGIFLQLENSVVCLKFMA